MTFKQILRLTEESIKSSKLIGRSAEPVKLVVANRRELGQLKRALKAYKQEIQGLLESDNLYDLDECEEICSSIEKAFERALILK